MGQTISRHRKLIVPLLGLAAAIAEALADGVLTNEEGGTIAAALVIVLGVYFPTNSPAPGTIVELDQSNLVPGVGELVVDDAPDPTLEALVSLSERVDILYQILERRQLADDATLPPPAPPGG